MRETFQLAMSVNREQWQPLWDLLHDEAELASCSSHVEDVREEDPGRVWSATLTSAVGRFKIGAPIQLAIVEEEPLRRLVVRLSGEDRSVGTRLLVQASGSFEPNAGSVILHAEGTYEVTGTVANLGSALVRKQARQMLGEFWDRLVAKIAATDPRASRLQ